jgi:hypothetical protein
MAARVWTVPASRMKSGREHRVALCEIFQKLARHGQLSRAAMAAIVPRGSSGLRSVTGPVRRLIIRGDC